jgi:uncharacterized membrane protein YhaH (DUF805 family)
MLATLFSFRGRLNRRAFFGWWVLAHVLLVFAIAIPAIAAALLAKDAPVPARQAFVIVAVLHAVLWFWIVCCLQVKRLRDIGLPPLPVIAAVYAICLVDILVLAKLASLRFIWPFSHSTPIGGFINAAYLLVLLFWPSARSRPATPDTSQIPPRVDPISTGSPTAAASSGFGLRVR